MTTRSKAILITSSFVIVSLTLVTVFLYLRIPKVQYDDDLNKEYLIDDLLSMFNEPRTPANLAKYRAMSFDQLNAISNAEIAKLEAQANNQ